MIDPDEAGWFGLGVFSGAGQLLALYGMPGMKRLYLIVASLFLLGVGAQAQEPIPTLDLTKPLWCEGQLPTPGIGSGGLTGYEGQPPPPRLALDLRLYFSGLAYTLILGLRRLGLEGTRWARAQTETIRRRLLKIGVRVKVTARRVWLSLAKGWPDRELFEAVWRALRAPPTAMG